ncbi:hypothetical protein EIN_310010 [Entamoeba invadens IP1]|uniref:Uncharacterized protein n=1 Tax=Entamoeba invadens IP1 TaxID=370355 RepID=A0A0A1U1R0_ENTIV|nr:hypothetical protein EIN_310010 [Entamoeba invadens IP1]ELP84968.1 hypothetical protein EIN_310010 [Entamoeba invadens IP1]|eukprot:XP_004184314.1 hypothetical protein EIN_310010 [Entamoeba invadens IP1]
MLGFMDMVRAILVAFILTFTRDAEDLKIDAPNESNQVSQHEVEASEDESDCESVEDSSEDEFDENEFFVEESDYQDDSIETLKMQQKVVHLSLYSERLVALHPMFLNSIEV